MACTAGGTTKPKCRYWDKCFRKEKAHLQQYLHPNKDGADTGLHSDGKTGKKTLKLGGKNVLFLGTFSGTSNAQMVEQAKLYGCRVTEEMAEDVDIVVIGTGTTSEESEAKKLGLRIVTADYWQDLLSRSTSAPLTRSQSQTNSQPSTMASSVKLGEDVILKLKRQRTHNMSDDEDGETTPTKKPNTSGNDALSKCINNVTATKHTTGSSSAGKQSETPGRKVKCKFWGKCYRKNDAHLKKYRHPTDDDNDDDDDDDEKKVNHHKELGDGEEADVLIGTRIQHIKRTGDSYYCDCIGWKVQKKPPNQRTCKHLKQYLGEEVENKRVGLTGKKENKGGAALILRPAKHKNISVLLAQKYTKDINPTGWWISEKLDGVRAYWDGKSFYSRLGNEFIPPTWFTENYPVNMHLDGELFGGRGKFQETVSIVKNAGSLRWKELEYHIFDAPNLGSKPFEDRLKEIQDYFATNSCKTAVVVEHTECKGRAQIDDMLKKVENLGGEGLMIRQPGSQYEHKRSNTLLKIKTFYDAEAIVIGHEQGKGRNSYVTGALRCRMECGKEFSVGSDSLRQHPPKIGSIITYRFQEYTNSGCPRFPTFSGERIDLTEPKDALLPEAKQKGGETN